MWRVKTYALHLSLSTNIVDCSECLQFWNKNHYIEYLEAALLYNPAVIDSIQYTEYRYLLTILYSLAFPFKVVVHVGFCFYFYQVSLFVFLIITRSYWLNFFQYELQFNLEKPRPPTSATSYRRTNLTYFLLSHSRDHVHYIIH